MYTLTHTPMHICSHVHVWTLYICVCMRVWLLLNQQIYWLPPEVRTIFVCHNFWFAFSRPGSTFALTICCWRPLPAISISCFSAICVSNGTFAVDYTLLCRIPGLAPPAYDEPNSTKNISHNLFLFENYAKDFPAFMPRLVLCTCTYKCKNMPCWKLILLIAGSFNKLRTVYSILLWASEKNNDFFVFFFNLQNILEDIVDLGICSWNAQCC